MGVGVGVGVVGVGVGVGEHWPWLNRVNVVVCVDDCVMAGSMKYMCLFVQHSLQQLITSSAYR